MSKWIVSLVAVCALSSGGCASFRLAQESLAAGQDSHLEIRTAFFVKAWGMNRALSTESRRGYVAEAKLAILESSGGINGTVDSATAMQALDALASELAEDEIAISENFAYIALLAVIGERADSYLDQAYGFIEAQKPIWMRGEQARAAVAEVGTEIEAWAVLVGDAIDRLRPLLPATPGT